MELGVFRTRGLAELESKDKIAFRLSFDGRRIKCEARLAAQRFAHQEIGERVCRSGHVRLRGRIDDGSGRNIGDSESEVVRLHPPRRRQRHGRVVARDGELVTGEGSRPLIGHHDRQAGQEVDADVTGRELAVQAFARQAAFVRHRVEVGGGPIGFQRSLKPSAVQILRAPFAYVGIDELRPQTNEIGRGARAGVDVELERRAIAVRRGLCFDRHVDGGSARCEAVEDELGRCLEEAGVDDHGLEGDRIGAGPFRTELRATRLEMRCPDPRRVGGGAIQPCARHASGRREPEACRHENAAHPHPRLSAPLASSMKNGDASGLLMRTRPAPMRELAGERAQRRVGRELSVEFDRNRPLRGQGRRLLVERLEVGEAQIMRLGWTGFGHPPPQPAP